MTRFWEILPGASAWGTLLLLIMLSWRMPVVVVVFILLYDLYWLLKLVYLFFHLRFSFAKMRTNMKMNWLEKLSSEQQGKWEDIHHLVIFPMYHEPHNLVRESFLSLVNSNYPKEKLFVLLAIEERGGMGDAEVAEKIKEEFGSFFKSLSVVVHPDNIEGELKGKSANVTWAAQRTVKEVIEPSGIPCGKILVSVFDMDSRTERDYFGVLTYAFLTAPHGDRSSYQPIPLYINNVHYAPFFARLIGLSSSFWQLMQESREEQLVTFSSHSMPLRAVIDIGYWDTNIVSEDSRIFFKCFSHYGGDWRVVPLFYPIYMDAIEGATLRQAAVSLYKQQRRWAWGAENISHLADDFRSEKGKNIPSRTKWFWLWTLFEGSYSWATSSFIIFFFGWLPNLIGGSEFANSVLSYNLPRLTGWILNVGSVGIIASAFFSVILLAPKIKGFKAWHYALYFLQWIFTPIIFVFFSSLPAIDGLTRLMLGGKFRLGYWKTPKAGARTS